MAVLFIMAKNLNIPGCPSVDEFISKLWHKLVKGSIIQHPKYAHLTKGLFWADYFKKQQNQENL